MANTYVAIATVTVGSGGASTIDFTSIPSTYSDLALLISSRADSVVNEIYLRFNGNSSSYTNRNLYGNGSSAGSGTGNTDSISGIYTGRSDYTSNTFANTLIYIPNYAGSNNKSVFVDSVQENNGTTAQSGFNAGLWSNSAAINQITLHNYTTIKFVQYSTATLYGIKNS